MNKFIEECKKVDTDSMKRLEEYNSMIEREYQKSIEDFKDHQITSRWTDLMSGDLEE